MQAEKSPPKPNAKLSGDPVLRALAFEQLLELVHGAQASKTNDEMAAAVRYSTPYLLLMTSATQADVFAWHIAMDLPIKASVLKKEVLKEHGYVGAEVLAPFRENGGEVSTHARLLRWHSQQVFL